MGNKLQIEREIERETKIEIFYRNKGFIIRKENNRLFIERGEDNIDIEFKNPDDMIFFLRSHIRSL